MFHASLPVAGGVAIGAVALGQAAIVAVAASIILAAAVLIRYSFRRDRGPMDS